MLAEDGYRPDIAVLDICMGELDGISLAKEINRLAPACPRDLPVELRGLSHGRV